MFETEKKYLESVYTPEERDKHKALIGRWLAGEISQKVLDAAIVASRPQRPPRTNFMRETPLEAEENRIYPDPIRQPHLYYVEGKK